MVVAEAVVNSRNPTERQLGSRRGNVDLWLCFLVLSYFTGVWEVTSDGHEWTRYAMSTSMAFFVLS